MYLIVNVNPPVFNFILFKTNNNNIFIIFFKLTLYLIIIKNKLLEKKMFIHFLQINTLKMISKFCSNKLYKV